MARLILDRWPGRVFKDDEWYGSGAYGYRSIMDFHDAPQPYADAEMFAVEIADDASEADKSLIDDILNARAPFLGFDIVQASDGSQFVVGRFHGRYSEFQIEQRR